MRYWPALPDAALQPAYAGIRPKISGPGEPAADFLIQGPAAAWRGRAGQPVRHRIAGADRVAGHCANGWPRRAARPRRRRQPVDAGLKARRAYLGRGLLRRGLLRRRLLGRHLRAAGLVALAAARLAAVACFAAAARVLAALALAFGGGALHRLGHGAGLLLHRGLDLARFLGDGVAGLGHALRLDAFSTALSFFVALALTAARLASRPCRSSASPTSSRRPRPSRCAARCA